MLNNYPNTRLKLIFVNPTRPCRVRLLCYLKGGGVQGGYMKGAGAIQDMPRVERPREKLMRYGPEKLADEELLAVLLRTGMRGKNVLDMAGGLLKSFGRGDIAKAG